VAGTKPDQFTAGQQAVTASQVQVEEQLLFERRAGALARKASGERVFQVNQAMGVPGPSLSTVLVHYLSQSLVIAHGNLNVSGGVAIICFHLSGSFM
jgi:hypothetical protein